MSRCPTCGAAGAIIDDLCTACGQEFCPECGAPLAEDAAACARCGATFDLICPHCEEIVAADATSCPHCGESFMDEEAAPAENGLGPEQEPEGTEADEEAESDLLICPRCRAELYQGDIFCPGCGQPFCYHCGAPVAEEAETCPSCGRAQHVDCPHCGFELLAGTELCPQCNAILTQFCPTCDEVVVLAGSACPTCGRELPVLVRETARVVHTVPAGIQIVNIVACSSCGTYFNPADGPCPHCGTAVCGSCQLVLEPDEEQCPRCGRSISRTPA